MMDVLSHCLLLLLMPPLLIGVINRTKALVAGRQGPPLLQAYYDIAKLLRKGFVISRTTTWIFLAAPAIAVVTALGAGLLTPFGRFDAPVAFAGDFVLFAYLLGLGRFFTTAAALDTGSAFAGMGASREVTFACLTEPALFLALLALARFADSLSLTGLLHGPLDASLSAAPAPLVLVAIGLFVIFLAENCRIPVDDPNTHLELTMIHEAMVLDHGGPLFGLVLYGAAVKLFVFGSLFLHTVLLFESGNAWVDRGLFAGGLLVVAAAAGVVESVMARLRMRHVPFLLIAAVLLCGFGFILLAR